MFYFGEKRNEKNIEKRKWNEHENIKPKIGLMNGRKAAEINPI